MSELPLSYLILGAPETDLRLGDVVTVNERSKYYGDWKGVKLRVVGIRLELDTDKINVELLEVGCKSGTCDGWTPEELSKEPPR